MANAASSPNVAMAKEMEMAPFLADELMVKATESS